MQLSQIHASVFQWGLHDGLPVRVRKTQGMNMIFTSLSLNCSEVLCCLQRDPLPLSLLILLRINSKDVSHCIPLGKPFPPQTAVKK